MAENTWVTESLSPYKLAQVLSDALNEEFDTDEFEIAPQQIYGAVRAKTLEVGRFDSGHMKVTPSKANEFIQARIDRQHGRLEAEAEAEEVEEATA